MNRRQERDEAHTKAQSPTLGVRLGRADAHEFLTFCLEAVVGSRETQEKKL